jgi:hypothetical protein
MSAQGLREAKEGAEKIASPAELADVQRRGRHALFASILATFIGAAPFVVIN